MNLRYVFAKFLKKIRGAAINDSKIHADSKIESGTTVVQSTVDRHSFCGYDCTLYNCDVGPFCSIASRVSIGGVAHPAHFVSTSPAFLSHKDSIKTKFAHHEYLPQFRTNIGADVWIGEGAFVKAGTHVGHGAIIGMGAVVTRDVPPYAVVAGNPAKLIRYRFEESVVCGLLASEWWKLTDCRLHELGPFMNDPKAFLARLSSK